MTLMQKIRKKLGWYDLEEEGAKYVAENIGAEYVDEFRESYRKVNRGVPIGGMVETIAFLELVETVKREMWV